MWYLASFVVFVACVKLLSAGASPLATAGVFTVCKIALALLLGGGFSGMLVTGAIASVVSFGYFWLLHRVDGSILWWLVLLGGVLLLA